MKKALEIRREIRPEIKSEDQEKFEDSLEFKIFNAIDRALEKFAPYVLIFATLYLGAHIIKAIF